VLFCLFANSINKVLHHARFLMFADDIKLFYKIDNPTDCSDLQENLNSSVLWLTNLSPSLNISKCHSMSFFSKHNPIQFTYFINGLFISSGLVVDLDVTSDRLITFRPHIQRITCKALKMLSFNKSLCSKFMFSDSLKTLYCCFV